MARAALTFLLVLVSAAAAAGAAGTPVPCGPKRAETLQTAGDARAWLERPRGELPYVFACTRGHARRRLGYKVSDSGVDEIWLNDRHVAWTEYYQDERDGTESTSLSARNLRTGAWRLLVLDDHAERVTDVVLRRDGAIAWIEEAGGVRSVRRRLRAKTVLLDEGTQIGPRSLRRRGDRVHWRNGHRARSAHLRR